MVDSKPNPIHTYKQTTCQLPVPLLGEVERVVAAQLLALLNNTNVPDPF